MSYYRQYLDFYILVHTHVRLFDLLYNLYRLCIPLLGFCHTTMFTHYVLYHSSRNAAYPRMTDRRYTRREISGHDRKQWHLQNSACKAICAVAESKIQEDALFDTNAWFLGFRQGWLLLVSINFHLMYNQVDCLHIPFVCSK